MARECKMVCCMKKGEKTRYIQRQLLAFYWGLTTTRERSQTGYTILLS